MNRQLLFSIAFVFQLGFFVGCGPMLLIPGGELSGDLARAPSDWEFIREISTVQLESRPSDPYSVNIWATGVGKDVYIHAGTNRANWIEHIEVDPRVRLQIGDEIYELNAIRVEESEEFQRFADAYEEKYGSRPGNENFAEVYLMRLEPR